MIKEIVLFGAFQLIGIVTWIQTSKQIKSPYMDEFFHQDQMDHYLNDDWSYWNDKLTTPPGTYILLYPFLKVAQLKGFKNSLLIARLLNSFLFGSMILIFLKKIFSSVNSKERVFLSYFTLFTPTIYFFSHLFYTDSASLAMCLGMYYFSQKERYAVSGIFGLFSILIRQTNVIWILYVCLITFINQNQKAFEEKGFLNSLRSLIGLILKNLIKIVITFKVQIVIVIGFICFIVKNGSIVLGDKSSHESSFHPTQLLYLSLFVLLNIPLSARKYLQNIGSTIKNQKLAFLIVLIISLCIVDRYTFAHKFILSDNRHYIFYIWKNFFGRYTIFKYLMAPIYSFAIVYLLNLFKESGFQKLKLFVLFASSCLALIPAGLVEFRYFTNSLVFFIIELSLTIHFNQEEKQNNKESIQSKQSMLLKLIPSSIFINIAIQLLINVTLLYVFILHPFVNTDGSVARFMF